MNQNVRKVIFVLMSFWSSIFGATAQTAFTNVNAEDFEQALKKDSVQLLDVRTQEEFDEGHLKGALLLDVFRTDFLAEATARLRKDWPVAVYCRSGKRSASAAQLLTTKGYRVMNLKGGIMAWISEGKPLER